MKESKRPKKLKELKKISGCKGVKPAIKFNKDTKMKVRNSIKSVKQRGKR